MLENTEG